MASGFNNYGEFVDAVKGRVRAGRIEELDSLNFSQVDGEQEAVSPGELAAIAMVDELGLSVTASAAGASDPAEAGQLPGDFGGYQIVRKIGQGGMGAVYEAWQESLGRRIAIKVLTRPAGSKNFGQRFHSEAKATSALNHPNIISAFDYGVDNGRPWLAMPFVDGVTLDRVESQNQGDEESCEPDPRWIARVGLQVADALAHAHDNGVIHRDIKPCNLMLDSSGKIWVTDFGLAKLRDDDSDLSRTGEVIGTPRYMAPEQVRGNADERSDIYSLGVTLWELATGRRAWDETASMLDVNSTIALPSVRDIKPDLPIELARIIDKACEPEATNRYQSVGDLTSALNQFAHGMSGGDRRLSRDKSRLAVIRGGAVAGLICLAGAIMILANNRQRNAPAMTEAEIYLKQPVSGRFIRQDDTKNVVTDLTPEPWRFIFLGTAPNGNHVVHIRNVRTGKNLDFDDSDFDVDVSPNVDEDSQWELIPAKDGTSLIRNRELGAYLHDEGDSTNYNVNGAPKPDADCYWQIVESQVERFDNSTSVGND